jgi:DNA-binding transcriptional LysR family regulator
MEHASAIRMKLQQLRFLATVAQSGLNISVAAARLHTTQPAVSKQLRRLEEELGFLIFERRGRALSRVTASGERVVESARRVLDEIQNIRIVSTDYKQGLFAGGQPEDDALFDGVPLT